MYFPRSNELLAATIPLLHTSLALSEIEELAVEDAGRWRVTFEEI